MANHRSGGVDVSDADIQNEGDIIGRDKIVHLSSPDNKSQEDLRSIVLRSVSIILDSSLHGIGLVGTTVFGLLAFISFASAPRSDSGAWFYFGVPCSVLAVICYQIYQRSDGD